MRGQFCIGELPLALIRMKAKGCHVVLFGNKGFTLPSNIGELGDDITKLDLSSCSLQGTWTGLPRYTTQKRIDFTDFVDVAQASSRFSSSA